MSVGVLSLAQFGDGCDKASNREQRASSREEQSKVSYTRIAVHAHQRKVKRGSPDRREEREGCVDAGARREK